MLKSLETAVLKTRNRIFILNLHVFTADKLFLVHFKKSETSHHDHIDDTQSSELLHLIDDEHEREGDKDEEWVSRGCHDYEEVERL